MEDQPCLIVGDRQNANKNGMFIEFTCNLIGGKRMFRPVIIDEEICDGCNVCVEVCLLDIFERNPEKGKPPILRYPDECAYDGACWLRCPLRDEGAIKVVPPLPMKVSILRGQ
jgi:NAD-dependent dihydropyrimidine dehydrogenase PreA subunit